MPRNEYPNYPDNVLNDTSDFEYLSKEQKEKLLDWCSYLTKIKTINKKYHAYSLKHIFENSKNGFYITKGTFKGAMEKLGFKIYDDYFNLSSKSMKNLIFHSIQELKGEREYEDFKRRYESMLY